MSASNPLHALADLGQSVWLDFIRRSCARGRYDRAAGARGRSRGMTSNPAIFEKAIADGREYDEPLGRLVRSGEDRAEDSTKRLRSPTSAQAADILAAGLPSDAWRDGFVSLEVSPELADDAARHARRGAPTLATWSTVRT